LLLSGTEVGTTEDTSLTKRHIPYSPLD